jgi:acetyltransferase
LFGTGGKYTEIVKDYGLGLPPLNSTLARRLIEKTQAYQILQGARGQKPVNIADLERLLITFSNLIIDHPTISEIEINPLIASSEGIIALDARVTLYEEVPDVRLTIQPYPKQYVRDWTTPQGLEATFRPIRPEDEPAMIPFHHRLSDQSVYQRYFSIMGIDIRIAHERLSRMCFIDYARQMAFVVEKKNPRPGENEILGIGRLIRDRGSNDAEFALLVPDDSQGQGYGTELLSRLIDYARDSKIDRIVGDILPSNQVMCHLCEKVGFRLTRDCASGVVKAVLTL